MTDWIDAATPPHQPRHRRDGVPLDGAPDLGLFATGSLSKAAADTPPLPFQPDRQPGEPPTTIGDGFDHPGGSPDSGIES
jgi:hypothetical protein